MPGSVDFCPLFMVACASMPAERTPRGMQNGRPIRLDRLKSIRAMLRRDGAVRVADLAARWGVSPETVRRDLAELEKAGVLARGHGGAVAVPPTNQERPYAIRARAQAKEKMIIARLASRLVSDGQVIALDSSTTALALADALRGRTVTLITNSVLVSGTLETEDQRDFISTGGLLNQKSMSLVGPIAEESARSFYPDLAFLSAPAVNAHGALDSNPLEVAVKKHLVAGARRTYVMADHTKFDRTALELVVDWDMVDGLICDRPPAVSLANALTTHRVQILSLSTDDSEASPHQSERV